MNEFRVNELIFVSRTPGKFRTKLTTTQRSSRLSALIGNCVRTAVYGKKYQGII